MEVNYSDHTKEVLREAETAIKAALEAAGGQAVTHAKNIITEHSRIATDAMRGSISHQVEDRACYVGTNVEYAVFNEMGTGVYIAGGRQSPWSYQDGKGEWHRTRGMAPIHFLKNALADHINEYKQIIEKYLKGG